MFTYSPTVSTVRASHRPVLMMNVSLWKEWHSCVSPLKSEEPPYSTQWPPTTADVCMPRPTGTSPSTAGWSHSLVSVAKKQQKTTVTSASGLTKKHQFFMELNARQRLVVVVTAHELSEQNCLKWKQKQKKTSRNRERALRLNTWQSDGLGKVILTKG